MAILIQMQRWLVEKKAGEYVNRERVKFAFIPEQTAWQTVHDILAAARTVGKEGQVAQYLVGAKLALRFPTVEVRNDLYSTSDAQSGLHGDFALGSTVFHVTVSPMPAHYDKCKANVQAGYDVYLLVPDRLLVERARTRKCCCRVAFRCNRWRPSSHRTWRSSAVSPGAIAWPASATCCRPTRPGRRDRDRQIAAHRDPA